MGVRKKKTSTRKKSSSKSTVKRTPAATGESKDLGPVPTGQHLEPISENGDSGPVDTGTL